ncbi:MAG: TonB-dependent receptor [Sphingobium phenoxybenzoativorans]
MIWASAAAAQDSGAAAQDAAQDSGQESAADSAQSGGITDIVVTAQRRSERLQEVPIAINVFNADALQAGGTSGVEQISRLTPGLYVGKFDSLRPQVYLRGIGSRVFDPGSEGSVGIFVNDSYMGRFSGSLTDLLDVERIEVLKGPQGTLYGRNTIGGAINIITRAPTRDLEGFAEASIGNFGFYDVRGAVSGPLTDGIQVRLAGNILHRRGYSENILTGKHGNGDDSKTIRAHIAAQPGEDTRLNLIVEYQNADLPGFLQETTGSRQFLQSPSSPSYTPTPDRYSDAYNIDGSSHRKLLSIVGKIEHSTDALEITSITSYRRSRIDQTYDLDATPRDIWTFSYDELSRQFSQELRLSSVPDGFLTFGDTAEWVLGGYYYQERTKRTDHFDQGADSLFHFGLPGREQNIYATDIDTDSYAVFGQYTVKPTDKLRVTIGGRYTHDKKDALIQASTDSAVPPSYYPNFTVNPGKSWSSFDPKFTIDYRFTRDLMLFGTVSRGFKSGGFQYNSTNAALASIVFNPERAWTYEVGLKSELFDRRVQFNASAFYYDYKNLQLPRFTLLPPPAPAGSGSNIISNAAKSTIKGIDTSLVVAVSDELTLTGGASYLDGKYDDYIAGAANYSGNRMIRSPKWQGNVELIYEKPITANLKLRARGDWSYTSKIFFEADEGARPFTSQDGYSLFNARLGIGSVDKGWSVDGWVRNITNKHYVTTIFAVPVSVLQIWSIPRTYGLTGRVDF